MKSKLLIVLFLVFSGKIFSQGCCSGGSGSPIAGGSSQGVLLDRQMEVASSFQYINSAEFKAKDNDTTQLFDNFNSKYIYSKIAYGITKDLTLSIESGYFINKTKIGLDKIDTNISKGIGDLILFPRYDVFSRTTETKRLELTLGLGYKLPLGKYNDSTLVYTNPKTGKKLYTTSPPLVQPTTGSHDFIFYAFFFRGFTKSNFRLFANAIYIKKGWNALGEKFGDYSSIGLFAGKTFFEKLGITLQLKGENIAKMKAANNVDLLALYNVDTASTGSRTLSLVPQVSFSYKLFTIFALQDIPLYQYVNGVQVATKTQFTVGISYRFFTAKSIIPKNGEAIYICPMNCEGSASRNAGKCKVCGMDLIKQGKK